MGADRGLPYLGVVLALAAVPALILAMRWALRRVARTSSNLPALVMAGLSLTSVVGVNLARNGWIVDYWSPTQAWRMATPLDLMRLEWRLWRRPGIGAADLAHASETHQKRWTRMNGVTSSAVAFPSSEYPLVHLSTHVHCVMARTGSLATGAVGCEVDADGDGFALVADCDDGDRAVHPLAVDLPGDGQDQDCSGADASPPNILLIVLESHRALFVDHLFPPPAGTEPTTPVLDRLAREGTTFMRASSAGVPTITGFMAIQTSLLPHPELIAGSTFVGDRIRSLPEALRSQGYQTRFVSTFDPGWDNQMAWIRRWYGSVDYSPKRWRDDLMFAGLAKWLSERAGRTEPFFVMATTATNHWPFEIVDGVKPGRDKTLPARIRATMRFADAALGDFIEQIRTEPWFENTVVIITGDHGFPLGEHGHHRIFETAHVESTGVPLVLLGRHPELAALGHEPRHEPVSHLDIAPTILDLAGIDPSGAWMGRSLLGPGEGQSLALVQPEWANERGNVRVLLAPAKQPTSVRVYDRAHDPAERTPLTTAEARATGQALADEAAEAASLMRHAYEKNRIWPPWLDFRQPPGLRASR